MLKPLRAWVNRRFGEIRRAHFSFRTTPTAVVPEFNTQKKFQALKRKIKLRFVPINWFPVLTSENFVNNIVKVLRTRRRKAKVWTPLAQWFPLASSQQAFNVVAKAFKTRLKQSFARPAKRARWFLLFHEGGVAPPIFNLTISRLKARLRRNYARTGARANWFSFGNFLPEPPTVNHAIKILRTRVRRVLQPGKAYKVRFLSFGFPGAPAPVGGVVFYVSPRISDSVRGVGQ